MTTLHRGSCLCGETVFEVHGPLRNSIACHCTQCRKQTGHYLSATSAAKGDFHLLRGERVRWYRASNTAQRAFCSQCGSTLFWQADAQPERISIATGLFDGPTGLVTEGHIFCADKGDYYVIPDEGYQRARAGNDRVQQQDRAVIPRTMKAVLLKGHGGLEQLEYRDDVPVPAPAAGEVLVQVGAAAVNNTDINTRIGWYSKSVATATADAVARTANEATDGGWAGNPFVFPRIQGTDVCGRIVAVGAGVAEARIGQRVIVDPVLRTADRSLANVGYVGLERDGGFAEFATVPASNASRIESALTDVELASFPCAYGTAENLLTRANVAQGETVLVTGASGGVGSAVVQLARLRGARVIAVTKGDKARDVLALGAQQTVERSANLVHALGRDSVDVVVDVVGGDAFTGLLDVLQRGGRYAVAGAIAGPVVPLDLRTLYLKDLSLLGCTVTTPAVFARLVELIQQGALQPVVRAVYPLADIALAQFDFLGKAQTGKIVLVP